MSSTKPTAPSERASLASCAIRFVEGSPRRKAALMSVNPTALTPIPKAIATTAAAANQRSLAMSPEVKRRSRSRWDETDPSDEKFRHCGERC